MRLDDWVASKYRQERKALVQARVGGEYFFLTERVTSEIGQSLGYDHTRRRTCFSLAGCCRNEKNDSLGRKDVRLHKERLCAKRGKGLC